jgi:tetraacyldisaccharide 4'-kinase
MPLSSAGWLYEKIADIRNALYDRGVLRSHDLGARTISIGNITAGGTGKTPLVAHVAEILADAGEKVCILTRGYGRKSSGRVLVADWENVLVDARTGGDEPVELARRLIGKAIVVADANRVSAAAWAKEKFGVTVFLLDDGFQHRRARRDLDIVCVDATNPFGQGGMLPAGTLREPLDNLARADAIVLTRCELAGDMREVTSKIEALNPKAKIFRSKSVAGRTIELAQFLERGSSEVPLDQNASVLAFCALGNPEAFFGSMRQAGYGIKSTEKFRDHHYYTQTDIDKLGRRAREMRIEVLATTAKDAVKLAGLEISLPCYVFQIRTEIDDADGFRELITSS